MFESLKNYISEIERIYDKTNKNDKSEKLTHEEMRFLESADLHLAIVLLDGCWCDVRRLARILLIETEK